MDFSKGCKTVLSLMENEPTKLSSAGDDSGSSSEGYHSEPESDETK
jgi:hypothetical protein